MSGRRLLCSRLVDVWIDSDKAPDPDTEPLSYRGLCQDVEKYVDLALAKIQDETMIKHVGGEVEISHTS